MDVVYATTTTQVMTPDGGRHMVMGGQHWPATDPVVKAAPPGLFSTDPRYGMAFSAPPPEMAQPPGEVEAATAAPGERRNVRRG
jgi:hypothetical protein